MAGVPPPDTFTIGHGDDALLITTDGDNNAHDLSEESLSAQRRQKILLDGLERQKKARSVAVPTNDAEVKKRLRSYKQPICLFGENVEDRRERLRDYITNLVEEGREDLLEEVDEAEKPAEEDDEDVELTEYYIEGSSLLKQARMELASKTLEVSRQRLASLSKKQQKFRDNPRPTYEKMIRMEKQFKELHNDCTEFGDESRPLQAVAFAPSGPLLCITSWSGTAKVFDTDESKMIGVLKGHQDRVTGAAWRPAEENSTLALATCGADKTIRLWVPGDARGVQMEVEGEEHADVGLATWKCVAVLKGHTQRVNKLAWHPFGRYLFSSSGDRSWGFWDAETEKCLQSQTGHIKACYAVCSHPEGSLVFTGGLDALGRVWDLRIGKCIMSLEGHLGGIFTADFHPNGLWVASGGEDNTVRLWDLRNRSALRTIGAHSKLVCGLKFEPKHGRFLASAGYDCALKLWNSEDASLIKMVVAHENRVMGMDIRPDGQALATTSFDRTFKLWSPADREDNKMQ